MINFFKAALVVLWMALMSSTVAQAPSVVTDAPALALEGFDPVAYLRRGRASRGRSEFQHDWDDARYHFSNAQHRATFVADPEATPRNSVPCASPPG